jgi:branched-chain amino acid transport system permease protein
VPEGVARHELRRQVGRGWWRLFEAAGWPKERWEALDRIVRRAIVCAFWVAIGILLVLIGGKFNYTVLLAGIFIFALIVPPYERIRFRRWQIGRAVPLALALVIAVVYPWIQGHMFGMPIFGPFPAMNTMVVMAVFVMMALGLNVVVGYAGLLDLGYVAFYAMGAYTTGWFASGQFAKRNIHFGDVGVGASVPGIHISVWLLLLVAGILTAFVGVLIGLPTLRLRGDYLAIVTLGFGEIMPQIARNGNDLFGTGFNLTGGTQGITPVDGPGFGNTLHNSLGLPANYLAVTNVIQVYYWTALVLVLITLFCSWRLRDSRLGRAWIAIREDEVAAAAMGVPLMRTKTWAYATGAFFGGIAGAYYASYKSAVFPDDFFFNISVFILCMVILGGMGNIAGVVLGACFLAYLDREGLANIGGWINDHFSASGFNVTVAVIAAVLLGVGALVAATLATRGVLVALAVLAIVWFGIHQPINLPLDVPEYEFGIFGVILLVVMLFRPEGLIPSARRKAEFETGVHDQPLYDAGA